MKVKAAAQCHEELQSDYFTAISEFLDRVDQEGFPHEVGGDRLPWMVCLIPEAAQQLILVSAVRSKLPLRMVDRIWGMASLHYSDVDLHGIFKEVMNVGPVDALFDPAIRKSARVAIEQGETEDVFDPILILCLAIFEVKNTQEEGSAAKSSPLSLGWGDFTQALMRRLAADGYLSDEDLELTLARDLAL